jgi:Flp pilus assembly protein TadD
LAERRYQEAFSALKDQNRAVAFAYLNSAVALSPDLAKSALTTSTLQNLERKLAAAPTQAATQSARQALQKGLERVQAGKLDADTQKLLLQAVETDYTDASNWEALGDFFLKSQNVDSARVMYGQAATLAESPAQKTRLNAKRAKISA